MQRGRIEIGAVQPHERMHLGIEGDLPKEHGIAERSEEFSRQDAFLLLQWLDGLRRAAGLQTVPVGHQLFLVELRPCFDEPALASRQLPGDQIDRVDAEDGHVLLMVRVEVRTASARGPPAGGS